MLDHKNNVTEGTSSNIFIIKSNELKTPEVNEFVLSGITRQVVLELAIVNKIFCKEQVIKEDEVYEADEVFITNTVIEILPVCYVNNHKIGGGIPGPLTKFLHKMFLKSFEE